MDFEPAAEQHMIVGTVSDLVRNELYPHEAEVGRLEEGARAFGERRDPVCGGR